MGILTLSGSDNFHSPYTGGNYLLENSCLEVKKKGKNLASQQKKIGSKDRAQVQCVKIDQYHNVLGDGQACIVTRSCEGDHGFDSWPEHGYP